MSYTFKDLETEVKARVTLDKATTEFDTTIKNTLNTSLFRVAREANWAVLRRKTTFNTITSYTTGSGAVSVTNGTKSVSVTGATFLTDGVNIGRKVSLGGSTRKYTIKSITGETTFTIDEDYDGTTSTTQSYEILPQEEYNFPIQAGRIGFLYHEDYGYPFVMGFMKDLDFFSINWSSTQKQTPVVWRQWDANSVQDQPKQAQTLSIQSSSSSDTNINITIYGEVSGFPDFETVATDASDGTSSVTTTKSFSSVERITKESSSVGRITVTADSGNTTVATLLVGDTAGLIQYYKVQIFPLPNRVFPIQVYYYKDPYRLVNTNDMHELGQEFDEAIILLTCAKLNYSQSKTEGDKYFALYKDEMKTLKKRNIDTIANRFDRLRMQGRHASQNGLQGTGSRFLGYSQLGGNFGPVVY